MPTDKAYVTHWLERLNGATDIRARAMFGEYGLYCQDKLVALLCDRQLLVKPTAAGRVFLDDRMAQIVEQAPYPGAKACWLIPESLQHESVWLHELLQLTARDLPAVKKPKLANKPKPN